MKIKIIALIFVLTLSSYGQDKRKVGLIPFENTGADSKYDWVSYGFEYYLSSKLSVLSGFFVSEKEPFKRALDEAGYKTRPIDEKMVRHIGKFAGVEVTIFGSYQISGKMIDLTVIYNNTLNGSTLLTNHLTQPLDNFFAIGRKIIDDLILLAGIKPSPLELGLLDATLTPSPRAFESFIKAYMENEKAGRIEAVIGQFRKAIREDPKFWEAYYNLGIVYYNTKKYALALDQFNKVIGALPDFDKPYYGRGLIYEQQRKLSLAIADFERVTEFNPNDYKPYYHLGRISISQQKFDQARKFLEKARHLNPEFAPTHYELGNIYYDQDAYRKSISHFKKAVKYDPDNAGYHLKLADAYYRSQVYFNALKSVNRSIELRPTDPLAYFLKGLTIYKQAVLEELVDAFLELLTESNEIMVLDDENFRKDTRIDPIKKKQVYIDMAIAFTEAVKYKPDFTEAMFNLALTYHEMGDPLQAEKYYLMTLKLQPNLLRAHLKLADLYTETNQKQLAIDQYRRVYELNPAFFVRQPTLGPEHHYINILEIFRKETEEKLREDPNDEASNIIIAKIFAAQGNFGKAANLARKVLTTSPGNQDAKNILAKTQKRQN